MSDKVWGIVLSIIIVAMLLFAIWIVYKEGEYLKEHPCIETHTETVCHTYDKCSGGIMLPGFCITEEVTSCREKTYCIKRK